MQAPGLEGAYVNGQKYRTTNKKERWFMTTLRHIAKTILCLMCRKVAVKRNYAVTVKLPPRTEGRRASEFLIPTSVNHGLLKRSVLMVRLLFLVMM